MPPLSHSLKGFGLDIKKQVNRDQFLNTYGLDICRNKFKLYKESSNTSWLIDYQD